MSRALKKPKQAKTVVLTPRDRTIIRACHRFRLISNEQLRRLTGSTSRNKFNDRLRDLWSVDFIDRPEGQRGLFAYGNRRPTLNALGQRGARWLSEHDAVHFPKGKSWRIANRELKSATFMEHRLGVVDCILAFQEALNAKRSCRFIDQDELLLASPRDTHRLPNPWRMPTQLQLPSGTHHVRSTLSDYTFGIGVMKNGLERKALQFLELDNGTEDFVRSNPDQSMILGLYLRYADAFCRQLHTNMYGFSRFRVLIVVNGVWDRVQKMLNIYDSHVRHLVPDGLFVHTTLSDIEQQGALASIWLTSTGHKTTLLPR